MGKLYIKVLPSLAESLGIEGVTEEVLADAKSGGGCSVRELLNRMCGRYRHFDQVIFDLDAQNLTGNISIFLNNRSLDLEDGLDTRLTDGDVLTFVPAIEGG